MVTSPSASYSMTVRLEIRNRTGMLGKVTSAIGQAGADIGAVDLVQMGTATVVRDITFNARDEKHGHSVVEALAAGGGRAGRARVRSHLPHAPRRQDRGARQGCGEDPR